MERPGPINQPSVNGCDNVRIRNNFSRRDDRREFAMASGELNKDAFLEILCASITPFLEHLVSMAV